MIARFGQCAPVFRNFPQAPAAHTARRGEGGARTKGG
jgi:hypothetical protein